MYIEGQTDTNKQLAKKIVERFQKKKSKRINWESHWQECLDYIVPRKADITRTNTPGLKRNGDLFDTTAIMANQLLAGALHGMLTNPVVRFFDLAMGDSETNANSEVKGWMNEVADRMYGVFNTSNFQTEIHEIYLDLGSIGTACMFIGEDDENVVHFAARSMKEVYAEEDNLGRIDAVDRSFKWNAKQLVQEFGYEKLPKFLQEAYDKGTTDEYEIIHAVYKDPENEHFAHKSCYVLVDKEYVLSEGGFKEFPYAVPRWTKTTGEIYGRGPGMEMLPDIKMVNIMMETTLKGAQKTVDPPLMVSDDGVIGRVRLTPGGLTIVRPGSDVPIRPLITDARIDFGYQAVEDVRNRIRSGFYVDQLQLNEGPQMTATEVLQRTEEKLRLMGPVLGRQHFEFLRPVIERVFAIMLRKGLLPPAPREIQGKKFDVRYSSLVARSQRMSEGQNFTRAIQTAAPIIQTAPDSLDIVDTDAAIRHIFDVFGLPHGVLREEREIAMIRQQRQQAQQAAMQQAQQAQQADSMGKLMPGVAQLQQATQAGAV